MLVLSLLIVALVSYVAFVFYANRRLRPLSGDIPLSLPPHSLPEAGDSLSVLSWNIGYAGLGEDADLIIDAGRSLRALPRTQITKAAQEIAHWLGARQTDVICLQENANAGFLTRQVRVRSLIEAALKGRAQAFWSDMKGICVPAFLRIDHGMSIHARLNVHSCTTCDLPQDDSYYFGLLKKHYGALVTRIPRQDGAPDWVVINLHLSAFDAGGHMRQRQLTRLLDYAQEQYEQGHPVVMAGDWNMRLVATDFAHAPRRDDRAWAMDFPRAALPAGWQLAVDPATPTVRALEKPFRKGRTYTTILDGFVYAPNVSLVEVATADLGFAHADHQPVEARFVAR